MRNTAAGALRVGLTGGAASGKSTAASFFAALGAPIIDVRQLALDAGNSAQPSLRRLVARFGSSILTRSGHLDPSALRDIVFSQPKARADLQILTHPALGAVVEARCAEVGGPYQVLIIPRLIENNLAQHFDRILVIDCTAEAQVRRLRAREGLTLAQAEARLHSEASRAASLKAAHDIINNDDNIEAVQEQVAALHVSYLYLARLAGRHRNGAMHSDPTDQRKA
ncbi:MAG TPA: dephospho-CoA kinase [Steroidobacteraceae bacterium]